MLPYFFAARHIHYARYITWHLLEMRCLSAAAKADLVYGAFVCRHRQGSWNAVSSDQFGEQTAIKIGKGGLKGITLDPEMVTKWISAFPIGAYICDTVDLLYEEDQPNEKEVLHKEEGFSIRRLDADDRRRVANELSKHPHAQEGHGEDNILYNIANGKIAPPAVNVADAVSIGYKMLSVFRKSLPSSFHAKMSSPVKTMEYLKRGVKVGEKTVFDAESIFLRILMVGQQRHLQLAPIFSYQLCAVPPSLVDEFGCLRRGNKAALMNRLGIKLTRPRSPDIVIVDGQLLYHVTWPCGGDPSVLVASMKARLASLPGECVLVFDRYDHVSPKDHELMRRGGVGSMNYNLAINSPLPSRDAILKNKQNKPVLKELHWLPVVKRIQFKVVTTVFKVMHDTAPAYLQELIVPYAPSRGLRSREHNLLCVPFTRSTVAGSRAFSIAGPTLWNGLPQYLRDISDISTFKKQLKTHLFLQHYGL